eukprot:404643-Rhodomonas_salina.1
MRRWLVSIVAIPARAHTTAQHCGSDQTGAHLMLLGLRHVDDALADNLKDKADGQNESRARGECKRIKRIDQEACPHWLRKAARIRII